MEQDIRYITVGIVVLVLLALFTAFVVWQSQRFASTEGPYYTVLVDGAVTGISPGSPVRYLGVQVGRVDRLELISSNRVAIVINLTEVPVVNASTVAYIEPQGITGHSYVALMTREADAKPAEIYKHTNMPAIHAEPSKLDRIFSSAPELIDKLGRATEKLDVLLNEDNRRYVGNTLDNLSRFSDHLDGLTGRLDSLSTSMQGLARQGESTLANVDMTLEKARSTIQAMEETFQVLEKDLNRYGDLAASIDTLVTENKDPVARFTGETLPEIDKLIRDMRVAVMRFETMARKLQEEPSRLLYRRSVQGIKIPQ